MGQKRITIAIDGHSSTGKRTMAKALAKRVGYAYVDTGAMYRAVTLYDLFLTYKVLEHAELNLSVQNLTDRYYLDPLAQSFMPAPGRTWRLGVQARF